jgi:OHCU decarboxylase
LSGWSGDEQAGALTAATDLRQALESGNRDYEQRFGHVFLISAAGLSAEDMLSSLQARLDNDPDTELAVAAAEQQKIIDLRLAKLLCP